ncbi:MAG: hypothetical protein J6A59_03815 [Lachnospiraceae bacterium]|nr:hypothetical protein [Lachnospiraceae bacterium]
MKYTINVDKNNYVLSIANTIHDNVEIDLTTIDLLHLSAYQLINNELVLDEVKLNELIAQEHQHEVDDEIFDLEQKLNSTDYILARMLEEIMALDKPLTFIADMIKIFIAYATKYKDTLSNRKTWRERIEELRNDK